MPARRPRHGDNDAASVEVIGFILTFAISAVVLVVSSQTLFTTQRNMDSMVAGVEMGGVADRISTHVVTAGNIAQDFPNATFSVRVRIPPVAAGQAYEVVASSADIKAQLTDDTLVSNATTYRLDAVPFLTVSGTVQSGAETAEIVYSQKRYINTDGSTLDGTFPSTISHIIKTIELKVPGE